MIKETDVTLLVNSCDAFSDVWDVFFEVLHKQWGDCPFEIVLNTETKFYSNPWFAINVYNLDKDLSEDEIKNISWSERLIRCLKTIKTKYVLFILEDIYLLNKVSTTKFMQMVQTVDRIPNFAMCYFYNYGPKYFKEKKNLYKVHRYAKFNYNVTCNFWNRRRFLKVLKKGYSPWESEQVIKDNAEKSFGKYYCTLKDDIISFDIAWRGIIQGKWAKGTEKLFEDLQIKCDFTKRGFWTPTTVNHEEDSRENYEEILQRHFESIGAEKSYFKYTLCCWRLWFPKWTHRLYHKIKKVILKKK